MGDGDGPQGRRDAATGERFARWTGTRLGVSARARSTARRAFPDHWSFLLGEITLYSFVIVAVTGVYLTFFFHPSMTTSVYDGSYAPLRGQRVSEAFDSTMHLSFDVRGGLLIRQTHHWAALVFVASLLVHLLRVFFTGAFRKPRELNWLILFVLLILAMFAGLTGYDLPDDLLSGTGLAVVNGTILSIPVVGTHLSSLLFGGEFPGNDLVARFNTLHVLIIPALMVLLFAAHLVLARRHGPTQYPGPGRNRHHVVGIPFKVRAVKSAGVFCLVAGFLFVLGAVAQINPVWSYGPYRPDQVSAGSQPDWYMGVLDGLLRVMPGWEVSTWGRTLALDNLIPLAVGGGLFLALAAYPFVEAWVTNDDREQHVLDRPRNRPVRTAFGAAWIAFYLVALLGAGNDIIAVRLQLSVESVTWAVRVGLLVVPPVVFAVTRRWAMGLQRRDRDMVVHGRETGVVMRLPHGEYVEVHEPLSEGRRYTLTQHEQPKPISADAPGDGAGGHGLPRGVSGHPAVLRTRAGISRVLYGDGAQTPKATGRADGANDDLDRH